MKQLKQPATAGIVLLSRIRTFIQWLPTNFSPLGSFGFFGQSGWFFITIIIFDLFFGGFYPNVWATYLGFAAYPLFGYLAGKKIKKQLIMLPLASFSFFLISNFGVWWHWYEHSWLGLIGCYSLALPFYTRTLLGDLTFGYGYLAVKYLSKRFSQNSSLTNLFGSTSHN